MLKSPLLLLRPLLMQQRARFLPLLPWIPIPQLQTLHLQHLQLILDFSLPALVSLGDRQLLGHEETAVQFVSAEEYLPERSTFKVVYPVPISFPTS